MVKEGTFNVSGCFLDVEIARFSLLVSVDYDKYVRDALSCFGKRSHDIHRDVIEWSRSWEVQHFTLMEILGVVSCAAWVWAYDVVDVGGHVGPVK